MSMTLADLDKATAHITDRSIRVIVGQRLPNGTVETFSFVDIPDGDEGYDPTSGPGLVLLGCDE